MNESVQNRHKIFRSKLAERIDSYVEEQARLADPNGKDKDRYQEIEMCIFELDFISYGIDWAEHRRDDWPFVDV